MWFTRLPQNPQNLVEKILRSKIYNHAYWKEHCFGLTAESLVDKAMEIQAIGGTFGGILEPTNFIQLSLKMLQIQPEKEIVVEFIKNEDYKYVRALGAFYMRLTGRPVEIYQYLEPLYNDYRKLRRRSKDGSYIISRMDEFIDELLREDYVLDIALPHLPKRLALQATGQLAGPRRSALEEELEEEEAAAAAAAEEAAEEARAAAEAEAKAKAAEKAAAVAKGAEVAAVRPPPPPPPRGRSRERSSERGLHDGRRDGHRRDGRRDGGHDDRSDDRRHSPMRDRGRRDDGWRRRDGRAEEVYRGGDRSRVDRSRGDRSRGDRSRGDLDRPRGDSLERRGSPAGNRRRDRDEARGGDRRRSPGERYRAPSRSHSRSPRRRSSSYSSYSSYSRSRSRSRPRSRSGARSHSR